MILLHTCVINVGKFVAACFAKCALESQALHWELLSINGREL